MEQKHLNAIQEILGNTYYNKITILHIKDMYNYGSKDLIAALNAKISFVKYPF